MKVMMMMVTMKMTIFVDPVTCAQMIMMIFMMFFKMMFMMIFMIIFIS